MINSFCVVVHVNTVTIYRVRVIMRGISICLIALYSAIYGQVNVNSLAINCHHLGVDISNGSAMALIGYLIFLSFTFIMETDSLRVLVS